MRAPPPVFDPDGLVVAGGSSSSPSFSTSRPWPLALVEVTPLAVTSPPPSPPRSLFRPRPRPPPGTPPPPPPPSVSPGPLSAPLAKLQLRRMCVDSELGAPGAGRARLLLDGGEEDECDDESSPPSEGGGEGGGGSVGGGDGPPRDPAEDDDGDGSDDSRDDGGGGGGAPSASPPPPPPIGSVRSVRARRTVLGGSLLLDRSAAGRSRSGRGADDDDDDAAVAALPVVRLPSDDPTDVSEGVPCRVRGYAPVVVPLPEEEDDGARRRRSRRRGRSRRTPARFADVSVTDGTLVRVLPLRAASWADPPDEGDVARGAEWAAVRPSDSSSLLHSLSGELPLPPGPSRPSFDEVLSAHDPDAVRSLGLRMAALLSRPALVGTTPDAARRWRGRGERRRRRGEAMGRYLRSRRTDGKGGGGEGEEGGGEASSAAADRPPGGLDEAAGGGGGRGPSTSISSLVGGGAGGGGGLVVHSPHPGHGKTLLVSAVARRVLRCSAVHVLNAPALFAEYGAGGADAALESLLHGIAMSAAVRPPPERDRNDQVERGRAGEEMGWSSSSSTGSACVILDGLDAFVPPALSGGLKSGGDPANPALNAIAAYLSRLARSLASPSSAEVPHPSRNPLYNLASGSADGGGFVLPVRVALVGVVTCDNDGGRRALLAAGGTSAASSLAGSTTVLDALGGARFRLPSPSATTRLSALRQALGGRGIDLDDDAARELPALAAGAVELRGAAFGTAAEHLERTVGLRARAVGAGEARRRAGVRDVKAALAAALGGGSPARAEVTFASSSSAAAVTAADDDDGGDKAEGKDKDDGLFSSVGGNAAAKSALRDALALDPRVRRALSALGRSAS